MKGYLKVMFKGIKVVGASICGKGVGDLALPFTQLITGRKPLARWAAATSYPTRSEITERRAPSRRGPMCSACCPRTGIDGPAGSRRAFGWRATPNRCSPVVHPRRGGGAAGRGESPIRWSPPRAAGARNVGAGEARHALGSDRYVRNLACAYLLHRKPGRRTMRR